MVVGRGRAAPGRRHPHRAVVRVVGRPARPPRRPHPGRGSGRGPRGRVRGGVPGVALDGGVGTGPTGVLRRRPGRGPVRLAGRGRPAAGPPGGHRRGARPGRHRPGQRLRGVPPVARPRSPPGGGRLCRPGRRPGLALRREGREVPGRPPSLRRHLGGRRRRRPRRPGLERPRPPPGRRTLRRRPRAILACRRLRPVPPGPDPLCLATAELVTLNRPLCCNRHQLELGAGPTSNW